MYEQKKRGKLKLQVCQSFLTPQNAKKCSLFLSAITFSTLLALIKQVSGTLTEKRGERKGVTDGARGVQSFKVRCIKLSYGVRIGSAS